MGYEQKQLLGRPLEDLVAPARRAILTRPSSATLAGRQVDNLELQILRGDGRIGHFSVNLSPMRDEQSHVSSLVVVMTDVTDAASLQSKLMHAEKMAAVGQLVSGVAHEVNNPLTAILGFADLLMENPELPESARKDMRVILQEAQRTKQIVQNLLSFARQMPPQKASSAAQSHFAAHRAAAFLRFPKPRSGGHRAPGPGTAQRDRRLAPVAAGFPEHTEQRLRRRR